LDAKRPKRKEHKTNWIRSCVSSAVPIRIHSIRSNLTLEDACVLELRLIAKYKPQLVNIHEGGNSGYAGLPEDAKLRHRVNTAAALSKIPAERKKEIISAIREAKAKTRMERAAKLPKWTKRNVVFYVSFSPCGKYVGLRAVNGQWTRCGSERAVRATLGRVLWLGRRGKKGVNMDRHYDEQNDRIADQIERNLRVAPIAEGGQTRWAVKGVTVQPSEISAPPTNSSAPEA